MASRKYPSPEIRFLSKINKEGPVYKDLGNCWEWIASKLRHGYGSFKFNGKTIESHRFSWEYFKGSIPENLCVLHKCDNPICVNPDHLFLGTHKDNTKDAIQKGRFNQGFKLKHTINNGEKNPKVKLTEKQVKEIRELYSTGNYLQKDLAKEYNVHHNYISNIINKKTWNYI